MDRRERGGDINTALLAAFQGQQASMWTALPGIIGAVNLTKMTVSIQPTLQAQVQAQDGSFSWVQLPLLVDCPIIFPSGGGCTLTFPIKVGDECLVIFASRCIDAWWQLGGIQVQAELRMHDLSDGFALVGPRSQPHVISGVSSSAVQLRSDDGVAYVAINPTTHEVDVQTSGVLNMAASAINIIGPITLTGSLTASGDVIAEGHSLATHLHGGVTPGGSVTSGPT